MTRDASSPTHRQVELEWLDHNSYRVTNDRGGRITMGEGQNADFTPVELLLTALAGCNAVTIEAIAMKRSQPLKFLMVSEGHKVDGAGGSRMEDLRVTFTVEFPDDAEGVKALGRMPLAMEQSAERFCTVSRTVAAGTPTELVLDD